MALFVAPLAARAATEADARFVFTSIDGGDLDLAAFRGRPVLVVNTASYCSFTPQYEGLQALYDRYRDRRLTVVGVPSNSFGQELADSGEVKDFCEVNFAVNFPMTELVEVTGRGAHPVFGWAQAQGFGPTWNFHKILLDGEGRIVATFPARVEPDAPELIAAIEALLPKG